MNAPFCPVIRDQPRLPSAPLRTPSIPLATDLVSLIKSVNTMRDILRSLTTSLTVNNVWQRPAMVINYYNMSARPDWHQMKADVHQGLVYYKTKKPGDKEVTKDAEQRAYVYRIDVVEYENTSESDDKTFFWRYHKELDLEQGFTGIEPYREDFFERITNVHWKDFLAVEFSDGAGAGDGRDADSSDSTEGGGEGTEDGGGE